MAGTYEVPQEGNPNTTEDPKIKTMLKGVNELLNSENKLGNTLRWYTPTIIAGEETRENTAYGTLTTPDEVKSVVLPTNGLILLGYSAVVKASKTSAGAVSIFIGANQLKRQTVGSTAPEVQDLEVSTNTIHIGSSVAGMASGSGIWTGPDVTTGQVLSVQATSGGLTAIFAAAGTYNVSVQFKASSGNISAKERKLYVATLGA